eukprot:gene1183-1199_t
MTESLLNARRSISDHLSHVPFPAICVKMLSLESGLQWHLIVKEEHSFRLKSSAHFVFSDHHEGSFGSLDLAQMRTVLAAWIDRTREISKLPYVEQVFVFENRGEEVGVTLNHPHGQIYSYPFITPRTTKMLAVAQEHFEKTGVPLISSVIEREIRDQIHVAPKEFVPDFAALSDQVADAFPAIAKEVLLRLDGVFGIPMAYIAAWHQAPVRTGRE